MSAPTPFRTVEAALRAVCQEMRLLLAPSLDMPHEAADCEGNCEPDCKACLLIKAHDTAEWGAIATEAELLADTVLRETRRDRIDNAEECDHRGCWGACQGVKP